MNHMGVQTRSNMKLQSHKVYLVFTKTPVVNIDGLGHKLLVLWRTVKLWLSKCAQEHSERLDSRAMQFINILQILSECAGMSLVWMVQMLYEHKHTARKRTLQLSYLWKCTKQGNCIRFSCKHRTVLHLHAPFPWLSFLRKAQDSGFKTNVFSALRNLTQFGSFHNLTSEKHCWQKNSLQVLHKITGERMTLPRAAHTAHLPHPTVAVNTQLTWRRHTNQHLRVCLLPET